MPQLRLIPPADWPTLGWEVIEWIEKYLCHGPGDVEGEPIFLDDEQCMFLLDAYRIFPKGHERVGQKVVFDATYSRPKGRAKSELAGMIVCAEALGPVRFSHWLDDGSPTGRPVRSPFIRCLATEEGQAGNTYGNVRVMLEHAAYKFPREFNNIDVGSTRVLIGRSGEIRPSSAGAASKDGGKESFAVADEVHLYHLPEHRSMFQTVRRNLRKRKIAQPWVLTTTTMYRPGQNSVAEGRHEMARKVDGKPKRDLSVLFDHREAPVIKDWFDDKEVLAGLVDVYGEFAKVMDMEGLLSEIRDPETEVGDAQRYFLNQRANFADTAFDLDKWDGCVDVSVVVPDRSLIVIGFDGARFDDATALVACDVETGYMWLEGLWEKPAGVTGWQVPEQEVSDAVAGLFDRHQVWRMYADPPYWESTVAVWQGKYGDTRVIDWWTNRPKAIAYACLAFKHGIVNRTLTHDGSTDLRRHIGNSYREELTRIKDENGRSMWRIRKERHGSPRKMDAAMAAVLAWEARSDAIAAGARKSGATVQSWF